MINKIRESYRKLQRFMSLEIVITIREPRKKPAQKITTEPTNNIFYNRGKIPPKK